jgi:hypothetical protein
LESRQCEAKPTKLRPKPQVSAAFRCSSIGIDAESIDPKGAGSVGLAKIPESRLEIDCYVKWLAAEADRFSITSISPDIW